MDDVTYDVERQTAYNHVAAVKKFTEGDIIFAKKILAYKKNRINWIMLIMGAFLFIFGGGLSGFLVTAIIGLPIAFLGVALELLSFYKTCSACQTRLCFSINFIRYLSLLECPNCGRVFL